MLKISCRKFNRQELWIWRNSLEICVLLVLYDSSFQETACGLHGVAANFWITYVQMLHLYDEFSRSLRTGVDLYVYCLPKVAVLFLAFNQPNYARWIVRYHDKLLRLKYTHPLVEEEFRKGGFVVPRAKKPFSKTAVDLTLE